MELKQVRKQELVQRSWRDATYWLASPGLLSFLSYRIQDYQPRDGTTHNGPLYWLVLCVNLTQAGVITEKGASVVEVPP